MSYTLEFPIEYIPDPAKLGAAALGELYIGVVNGNPAFNAGDRVQVYIARQNDTDLAIPQPIDISAGGVPVYQGNPVTLKINQEYSIAVLDINNQQIYYSPKAGNYIAAINSILSRLTALESVDITVATFTDLSTTQATAGSTLYLKEYNSGTGRGGGHLIAKSGSVTPNNVLTFASGSSGIYFERINYDVITPEMGGVVYGGVVDDTVALQRLLTAGLVVTVPENQTSLISSRLNYVSSNSGFVGNGSYKLLMSRSGFGATAYAGTIQSNNCGLYGNGLDGLYLGGVHFQLQSGSGIRVATGAAFDSCTNMRIGRVEFSQFNETEFGCLSLDSCTGTAEYIYVHDVTANSNTLPSIQLSGIEVDEARVGGVYSQIKFGTVICKNITLGATALAAYGYQTDGIVLAGGSTSDDSQGCAIDTLICDNVYEPLDIQSRNNYVGSLIALNCVYGAKFVHAAKNNTVAHAVIKNTFSFGAVFSGTNTASQNTSGNRILRLVTYGIGSLGGSFRKAAIGFDGGSATLKPGDNGVLSLSCYETASMQEAIYCEGGNDNFAEIDYLPSELKPFTLVSPATCSISQRFLQDATAGYVTGRYYGGDCINSSSTTALAIAANTLYATPFIVRNNVTFGEISFHVTTAGAGSARLGIYKFINGVPTALVLDAGTVSVSTTGLKTIPISIGLTPGVYALAIVTDIAVSIYSSGANVQLMNIVGVTNIGNSEVQISRAFTFAALPAIFGTVTYTAANVPNLFMRKV